MNAEKVASALLNGAVGVTAIVGTRIYGGELMQAVEVPALCYTLVSDAPVRTLNGLAGGNLWEARIQVTAYTSEYLGLKTLLQAVLTALQFQGGVIGGVTVVAVLPDITGPDLRSEASLEFYGSQDFLITYQQ